MKPYKAALVPMLLMTACQRDIDIEYHDIAPLTVIEAELTPDGAKVAIRLTTPMDEPMDRTLLTDASVTLTDLTSGAVYELLVDKDGFFTDPTPGLTGHDYSLTVTRAGETFESRTTMYPPTEILGLQFNWINMPYDQVAILQGLFLDDTTHEGDCYWIKLYRNGEIYMWNQIDDRAAVGGIGSFVVMTSRRDTDAEGDDTVLFDGDVITMTLSPVSRTMYNYLEALQNDSSGPALFSGPRCLGYFIATSPTSTSITFHPDEIPIYK